MKRFEYKIVEPNPGLLQDFEKIMNDYGNDGWELTGVVEHNDSQTTIFHYFKKEIQNV